MMKGKSMRSGMGVRTEMMIHHTTTTLLGVNTGTNMVTGVVVVCMVTLL